METGLEWIHWAADQKDCREEEVNKLWKNLDFSCLSQAHCKNIYIILTTNLFFTWVDYYGI